jgi:tricarballylate dehydrogenase
MAGNVLGKGYTAGVGMTIGTVFGRIAGASAAKAAASLQHSPPSAPTGSTHSHLERSRVVA